MAVLALILGIIGVLVAFGTNTAPEGTHNLGLLQQQMMALYCGLALLIIAAIRRDAMGKKAPAFHDELKNQSVSERTAEEVAAWQSKDNRQWLIATGAVLVIVVLWATFR